jgi:formate hydrogenlyase subunit 6/NADH:ubiquinone oxidoreductase subunit I
VGAALKDFQDIESYSYYFTHAQADIIDISAFPHSVISAKKGIAKAIQEKDQLKEPLIMVSVNIGKDPHFRRIELDKEKCTECLDCIPTCPSQAFTVIASEAKQSHGSIFQYNIDLCFGCSNCLPACKDDALSFQTWDSFDSSSLKELTDLGANAIEIHLNNDLEEFKNFYNKLNVEFELESFCIGSQSSSAAKLESSVENIIEAFYKKHSFDKSFIIQVDGVPISGAKEELEKDQVSINKAKIVMDFIENKFPSFKKKIYVQIAGGTNSQSLKKALEQNILINGVAIGSYARKKLKLAKSDTEALEISKNMISFT